jgi:hypothetical protein
MSIWCNLPPQFGGHVFDFKEGPYLQVHNVMPPMILHWWNPVKLHQKKAPKKGREKETRGKPQSPGKQTAQKGPATRQGNHEVPKPLPVAWRISTKGRGHMSCLITKLDHFDTWS